MAAKLCPFVMAEIVLPELSEESHQPVSAQFSLVSNLPLARYVSSKLSTAIGYYEDTASSIGQAKCRYKPNF